MRTLTLLFALAFSAPAADPPTVEQLIEQLGSKSFPVRERATKALKERGASALPLLRKVVVDTKDEEIRKRIEGLIPGMEIDEALLAKRLTLKGTDVTLTSLFADLQKQTGYKFSLDGKSGEAKRTVDLKDGEFWDVLEKLSTSAERITVLQDRQSSSYRVPPRSTISTTPFANNRGPFRIEAAWVHEDRDADLSKAKDPAAKYRDSRLTLSLNVFAEPRITFLKISPAKIDEAIDSDGKSLIEPTDAASKFPVAPNRSTFRGESLNYSDVRLLRASETAKTIKLVRGTVPVKMILIRKPVVVTSKITEAAGTKFQAGSDGLEITRVSNQGGNNIEVEIQVPRQRGGSMDENWYDRFELEDDAGNRFQSQGSGSRSDGRGYWISKYFGPPFNKKNVGPPTKLILDQWIIHEFNIPFEFRDIPMP